MFKKHEVHHSTGEQVGEYLQRALQAVEELDPPEDLRVSVFNKAVELYSGKTVTLEQVGVGGILSPNGPR